MPLARASELDRLLACAGSLILPRQVHPIGVAATWGNLVHHWAETGGYTDLTPPGERAALEERIALSGANRESLWPSGGYRELALAYNVVTGEADSLIDGRPDARDDWKASFDDNWVVGTADYAGEFFDIPWVDDLKTGRFAAWKDYAAQQTFYCLAYTASIHKGLTDVRTSITHWPKYPKARPPARSSLVLSSVQLARFAARLASLRERMLSGSISLETGSQCLYCPSRAACPKLKEEENGTEEV